MADKQDPRRLPWGEVLRMESLPTMGDSVYDRACRDHDETKNKQKDQ